MNRQILTIAAALGLFCSAHAKQEKQAKPDANPLIGTWDVVDQQLAMPPIVTYKLEFTADKITWYALDDNGRPGVTSTPYKLDPKANPKRIDFWREQDGKDKPYLGIYELQGDMLRICYQGPKGERPVRLAREGRNMLYTLKKKTAADPKK